MLKASPAPAPETGPRHVAIIMDGNGRWATRRGLSRLVGHKRGVEAVRRIVEASPDLGVEYLTIFAFSTENWKRSEEEVGGLMHLFRLYIRKEAAELDRQGVRVRFIGDREALDPELRKLMNGLEARTAENGRLNLTVALNYGGRDEIAAAARRLAEAAARGEIDPAEIDEDRFAGFLYTDGLPDPDLVIRTSGEMRVSNFLTWQSAYSEYVFVDECWPDFTPEVFAHALGAFGARECRFGAVLG
jgi:undecaprenyl diphosphate synthase